MKKEKNIFIFTLIIIGILLIISVLINKKGKPRTPYNAYPTELYYNDVQVNDVYIFSEVCYIDIKTLSEVMNFDFECEPFDPVKNLGEGYFNPYDVYGTFTLSYGVNTVVITNTSSRSLYKNGEDISRKIHIQLINKELVDGNIEYALDHGYAKKNYDLKNYLKKDAVYISLRDILDALEYKYTITIDESTGNIYVYSSEF